MSKSELFRYSQPDFREGRVKIILSQNTPKSENRVESNEITTISRSVAKQRDPQKGKNHVISLVPA